MKNLCKALIYVCSTLLALLTFGGVLHNLNIVIELRWWETVFCFVAYVCVRTADKWFPIFPKEVDYFEEQ